MKLQNTIYCGDNLEWMLKMPDEFVDLCYIDPPFFSNKYYEVIFHDGEEIRSFEDRWKGGIHNYIEWMRDRVFEIHRILKNIGSFYLHCDWHASHYLKVMMDEIFGINNFRNEIVWCYYGASSPGQKQFPRKHDTIFWYSKSDKWIFNADEMRVPYSESTLKRISTTPTSIFHGKRTKRTAHKKGKIIEDHWHIPPIVSTAKERLGYPTQKPEKLIELIIKASSKEGDLVFDPFCGCGTSLAVAHKLKRNWLGIDVSPTACKLMKRRLEKVGAISVKIIGMPLNNEELKALKPLEFQNWIIGSLGGTVSDKKSADMGIDGYTFMTRDPIQVKQSENVGRNVVDNFETAIRRVKKNKGVIVAFSFTRGAYEEVARAKEQEGLEIELMTIQDVRNQM